MPARGWIALSGFLGIVVAVTAVCIAPPVAVRARAQASRPAFTDDVPSPAPAGHVAGSYYKNLQILKQLPAQELIPTMLGLRIAMGVDCSYCHAVHEWQNDTKTSKLKARAHFQMVSSLRDEYFDKKPMVSCWTCHRGRVVPETLPSDPDAVQRVANMINVSAADQNKPAEQVFKNISVLKGVPAGNLPKVMALFSRSLGVRCTFCHVPDNFAADDKDNKKMARKMLGMVHGTLGKFYDGDGPVACFTCHHGSDTPEISPGKAVD